MNAIDVLRGHKNFAVIGATNNQEKYGYKIFQCLKDLGKNVYGISPVYRDIEGTPTYPDLSAVKNKIDVAVFVVSPKFGVDYVKECQKLKIEHIWLQPGTYNDELISMIKEAKINYYLNCVLVESQNI